MQNLDAVLTDARPGVQAFTKQTLPEVGQLVRDLRADHRSAAQRHRPARTSRAPAAIIGGAKLPDYEPREMRHDPQLARSRPSALALTGCLSFGGEPPPTS